MRALILAGGYATRLWPLTEKRAKPLLPLAGRPIIGHLLDGLPRDMRVTVSTNAAFEDGFRAWVAAENRPDLDLVVEGTRSDDHKLGALGALAAWVRDEKISEDLLLLTGDNYLGFRMEDFIARYKKGETLLAAHDIDDTARASAFGTVLLDPKHPERIAGFEEKPHQPKTTLVSAGCSVLPASVLPVLLEHAAKHPDNVGGLFEELLRRGLPVRCFIFREPWMDIGSFGSYLDAHRLLVGDKVMMEKDATMTETETTGSVCIGRGSRVERSQLQDCVVFERSSIVDCTLRNCVVDEGCRLRGIDIHNQMIRAGTVLDMQK